MAGPCFEPLPAKPLSAASNRPCYHFGRARPAGGTANAPRGGRADERGEGTSQPAASVRARRAPSELRRTCGQPGGPESAPESSERSGRPRQRPQVPRKEGRQDPRRSLGPLSGQEHPGSRPAKRPISSAPRRIQEGRRKNEACLRSNSREVCTAESVSAKSLVDALSTLAFPSYIRDSWIRTQACTVFSRGVSHNGRTGRAAPPGARQTDRRGTDGTGSMPIAAPAPQPHQLSRQSGLPC